MSRQREGLSLTEATVLVEDIQSRLNNRDYVGANAARDELVRRALFEVSRGRSSKIETQEIAVLALESENLQPLV